MPNFNRFRKAKILISNCTLPYKRTLTLLKYRKKGGRNSAKSWNETHQLFKDFVEACASVSDIEQVATGRYHWYDNSKMIEKARLLMKSTPVMKLPLEHTERP